MKCNRCNFEIGTEPLCINCGELNKKVDEFYRVDAQNYLSYWIEQCRTRDLAYARQFVTHYNKMYPGCPVKIKFVTEEEVK